jgi:hypothetical protein
MRRSGRFLTPVIAAIAVSAPGAVLAAGAQASTISLPSNATLVAGLETLTNQTNAVDLVGDVAKLAANPSVTNVGLVDNAINTVLGATALAVPARTASAGASLESAIAAVSELAPSSPSAAQTQALSALGTSLLSAGLSTLISGLGATASAAVTQIAALQTLAPGTAASAGGLSDVSQLLTALAGEAGATSTDGAALSAAASTLNGSAGVTAAQLQAVVSGLASVTSPTASATSGVSVAQAAAAIASTLSQSGSLFGALDSVGSTLSTETDPSDVTNAVSEVNALGSLQPGATTQLPGIGAALTAFAGTPGLTSAVSNALESLGSSFTSGLTATQMLGAVSTLQAMNGLPSLLNGLAANIASELSGSGAVLGGILDLSSTEQAEALSDLAALAGLGQGAQTGELPGLAAVLNRVLAMIPSADSATAQAVGALAEILQTDRLDGDELNGAAEVVTYASETVSGQAQSTLLSLATVLSHDATDLGLTATATSATAQIAPSVTTSTIVPTVSVTRAHRLGNIISISLSCPARGANCAATVKVTEPAVKAVTKREIVAAGTTRRLAIRMAPRPRNHPTHVPIRVVVSSASRQIIRALA